MEQKDHTRTWRSHVLSAALAVSLTALVAGSAAAQQSNDPNPAPPAPAQQQDTNQGQNNPGNNGGTVDPSTPSSLNPGGVQGRPNGAQNAGGEQVQGTPTGAAAQGNSALGGSVPSAGGPTPTTGNGNNGANTQNSLPPLSSQQRGAGRISVQQTTTLSPIIRRAQDMLRVAQARQLDAPSGARASYRKAAQSLRQMLSATGQSTASSNSLGANPAQGIRAAAPSSIPVSSDQISDDIRVLRLAARQRNAPVGMTKIASLYASGAKEFFTGQLRDALLDSPVRVALRTGGARVQGESAPTAQDEQIDTRQPSSAGAAAVRSDRPEVPFPITLQRPQQQTQQQAGQDGTSTAASSELPADDTGTTNVYVVPPAQGYLPYGPGVLIQGFNTGASATAGGSPFPVAPGYGGFGGFVQPLSPNSFGGLGGYFGSYSGGGYFNGIGF